MVPCAGARAAAPWQGIYTVIDPYNPANAANLAQAAQARCGTAGAATPFCGASNGILLRVGWCDFQLYHALDAQGHPYPSCHYQLSFSAGVGSPGVQTPSTDSISPCPGEFDTCTGAKSSLLGAVLANIAQIQSNRTQVGLPPLLVALGLAAGENTAQTVLNRSGFVDVPHSDSSNGNANNEQCLRLPLVWKSTYIDAYQHGFDTLLTFVRASLPADIPIAMVKIGGINARDLEIEMPGRPIVEPAPSDPGPAGPGPLLTCPTGPAADTWLDAYTAAPLGKLNFSQAVEATFGHLVGHIYATVLNAGLTGAELSIPTTGGEAMTYVDCGTSGNGPCAVIPNTGNWSYYYLWLYASQVFTGGIAQDTARTAYQALRADTFSLPPTQLGLNYTGLGAAPIKPAQQMNCVLNNQIPANTPSMKLGGVKTELPGVGSQIGWQTATNSGGTCASGGYAAILSNGLNEGGLYLEIQTDAAFTHIADCEAPLSTALNQVLAASAPTTCVW